MTSMETCISALRNAAATLDESPSKAQYETLGFQPASATIIRVMGGWNDAKEAAGLETAQSTGTRVGDIPPGVDVTEEEWTEMSVDQRWHYRNVEHNTQRTLDRRAELRAAVYEVKRVSSCERCGESETACLDFHHLHGESKVRSVGSMVSYGYSIDAIMREIEKCIVLCANCHREEHHAAPALVEAPESPPHK